MPTFDPNHPKLAGKKLVDFGYALADGLDFDDMEVLMAVGMAFKEAINELKENRNGALLLIASGLAEEAATRMIAPPEQP